MKTIPFDLKRWQEEKLEVIYRNGKKPKAVSYIPEAFIHPVLSVNEAGHILVHTTDGHYCFDSSILEYHLFLIEPEEIKEFWMNLYGDYPFYISRHTSLIAAKEEVAYSPPSLSPFKAHWHLIVNYTTGMITGKIL